jgi:sporulation protein YqfC
MQRNADRSRRNRGRSGKSVNESKKEIIAEKITEKKNALPGIFDVPGSALSGICHIELAENREAVIDGCQGVVEYDEHIIKLATGKMVVKFTGRGLQINVLTRDSAVVTGFITGIEFIV